MKGTFQVRAVELDERGRKMVRLYRTPDAKRRRTSGWTDRLTFPDDGTVELGDVVTVTVVKLEAGE